MNFINPNQQKIIDALDYHYKFMYYVIKTKINGRDPEIPKPFLNVKNVNIVKEIPNNISNYLNNGDNLKKILKGKPQYLDSVKDLFSSDAEKEVLKKIFKYDSWVSATGVFDDYNPYNLAEALDIQTCTYCNRMYTKTVVNKTEDGEVKKITRPEFDHWFPKGKYPMLALSFFNLIPSCHVCNSNVKGENDLTLTRHLHPYRDKEINMQFSYEYNTSLSKHKFKLKFQGDDGKAKRTAEEFKLKEIYETHEDEIKDLLRIRSVYSKTYLKKLDKLLGVSVSYKEVYRLAFGTYIEESKFDKRPLSRMKRDILKELGIIKERI